MIDVSKLGLFSFVAKANLYLDNKVVTAETISGTIVCSGSSP